MTEGTPKNEKPTVVLGFFGTTLDAIRGPNRWEKWRPTLSALQHEDLLVSRLELLMLNADEAQAETLIDDIAGVSPDTGVGLHPFSVKNAWEFEEMFEALHEFARKYPFDQANERYLVHITTG